MSQTVITQAFEELKAQEAANGGVVTLDEFVFASVPNLNITDPIDRAEGLPPAAQIVHRQSVSKTGMVNSNAVVYSAVLGADVGDFEFNWVGLLNKASGVVAMIVHAPSQKKIRTQSGQQGNVLTRSFLMEYNGASEQTQIITPADTWQIDFTARLNGVDERTRQENIDAYGTASFFRDGFLVSGENGNYLVKKGIAYIKGLRAELQFDQALAVATRPSKIWVDVCWRGTLTSVWKPVTKLTVAETLADYAEGDEQHYVFAVAEIQADGTVIDLRQASVMAQMAAASAEPDTVHFFDEDAKLRSSAISGFGREMLAIPDAPGALFMLGLSDPAYGDSLLRIKPRFANSVARTQADLNSEWVSIKEWGVTPDGKTDWLPRIQAACNDLQAAFLIDGIRRTLVFPEGSYRTSGAIVVHANMGITCIGRVIFQNVGTDKSFTAVELQGGAKKSVLGVIDGYGKGILIRGSTHNVDFQTISNCTDGVIIRADANWTVTSSLDNVVRGIQIGKCTNGIIFEQNADGLVQQGNDVRVNFVSESQNTLVFRNFDGVAHTKQSNWDSNYVELIASDPLSIADAAMARNLTGFGVPNLTYSVLSWCGGWVPEAGTICLVRGPFSVSRFVFNLAQRIGLNELVDVAGRGSLGSCDVSFCRNANLGSATAFYQTVAPGASFNGGVALNIDKFRLRMTVPDLAAGQTFGSSFWHVLAQVSGTSRVRLEQYSDFARGKFLIEVRDSGTERQGMVRIWITNISTSTVTGGDIDMIISAN